MMNKKFYTIQIVSSVLLLAIGAGLLIAGFIVSPLGEIHQSVFIVFGELLGFVGAVFGIDYKYKQKHDEFINNITNSSNEKN